VKSADCASSEHDGVRRIGARHYNVAEFLQSSQEDAAHVSKHAARMKAQHSGIAKIR